MEAAEPIAARAGWAAQTSAYARAFADWLAGRRRWLLAALATYLLALVVTFPAGVAASWAGVEDIAESWSGTVWDGAARLPGGHMLGWSVAPLQSLLSFGLALDVRLEGPETEQTGEAVLRPGLLQLRDVRGRTGWSLLRAFGLDSRISCDVSLRTDLKYIALGDGGAEARGSLSSGGGGCIGPGAPKSVPPLTGVARSDDDGAHLSISARDDPDAPLMNATAFSEGGLRLAITAAGARALPGVRGATSIEISD